MCKTRSRDIFLGTATGAIVLLTVILSSRCYAAVNSCQNLFAATETSLLSTTATSARSVIAALRGIEDLARQDEIDFRHPLSPAAIDYIREATGFRELTDDQATELYNNNLRLLVSRAKAKAEDLILDGVLRVTPMTQLEPLIHARLQALGSKVNMDVLVTTTQIRNILKQAIHNIDIETFSIDEIVGIVELQMLFEISSRADTETGTDPGDQNHEHIRSLQEDLQSQMRPQISFRLQVEREPGCCRTAICNTCPNSFRLKEEVMKQTGKRLNTHLKPLAGVPAPPDMLLFDLQNYLKRLVPDTNW